MTRLNGDSLSMQAVRIQGSIRIDGSLDEACWQTGVRIHRFIQREPKEGEPSTERTDVRILYDEKNLYIGFHCWDSEPHRIVANEMRRDADLTNNDCVIVLLDTYHDHRSAFCFCTNPLGAQRDGLVMADASDDEQNWDWNGVWDNACRIDSAGWTAEIAIPFKILRFYEVETHTWGLNLARIIPRNREEAFWAPIWREYGFWGKYRIRAYGHLEGLRQLRQPSRFEWKPYILSGLEGDLSERRIYKGKLNLGLDAKVHVTSNLTADLSLNTDFAQVEADQEQVNLTRFELFFPEKRDFFLEGASIFRFGERPFSPVLPASELFFSRRIGLSEDNEPIPLLGGVKMTGKTGAFNIGFLNMLADRKVYDNDDDEHVIVPRTNFTALRIKRDILVNSSVGFIGLNKESLDDGFYNRCAGLDAQVFLTHRAQMSGFVAKTFSTGQKGKDMALYGDFYFHDDFWTLLLAQNSIQDNFNPEMGFVPRTGIRKTQINFGISPRPKIFNIRQTAIFNDFYYIATQEGELETRLNFTGVWNLFQNGASLTTLWIQNVERLTEEFEIHEDIVISPGMYRFNNFFGEFASDMSRTFSGKVNVSVGRFYDGRIIAYGLESNLKWGSRFTVNVLYNHNDVQLEAGCFQTDIVGIRLLYSFSPRLFVKTFIQCNSEKDIILGHFLLHFIHRPGSDLYLVYNEELETGMESLHSLNRVLMLKYNYLF